MRSILPLLCEELNEVSVYGVRVRNRRKMVFWKNKLTQNVEWWKMQL